MKSNAQVLYVVNELLPETDYRLVYAEQSGVASITYGLPAKPESLAPERYVPLGFGEGLRPGYLREFVRLWSYLRRNRGTLRLVHFFSTYLMLGGPVVARLAGVPCLVTVTGFGRVFSSKRLRYRLMRPLFMASMHVAFRCCRSVLFQNHGDMEWLAGRMPSQADKFTYAGSAVETPIVHDKGSHEKTRVLLAARLIPEKGIDDFLSVAERLTGDGFEFVLAGPASPGFDDLLERVQKADRDGIVRYAGELSSEKLSREFAAADLFFFPSSYGEGLSRTMLECGFARACPVAYDIPSNRDLISDRGFLVDKGDIDEAERLLRELAGDRELLDEHAAGYQAHIVRNFGMQTFSHRMDEILTGVVSPP